jgi:nucleoside-diphosphate-sugar epimerase
VTPRVAVTGASGFIGTALVQALAGAGARVVATDRFAPAGPLPAARFLQGDVRDPALLDAAFAGAEVVYHLAALASIARAPEAEYRAVNAAGTERVLARARAAGVAKVVHLSSSTVYGAAARTPIAEDAPLAPACPYSRSKAAAELACARHGAAGLDVAVIRPRVVVGPGRAGIFELLFTLVAADLPVPLVGAGARRFQFTSVDDLAAACLLAAAERAPGGGVEVYNVGSAVERPLRDELAELLAHAGSASRLVPLPARPLKAALSALDALGVSPLVAEQLRVADVDFVLDTARARERLGFVPAHRNVDGLLAAWDWWAARRGAGARRGVGGVREVLRRWRPRYQNALQRRGEGR